MQTGAYVNTFIFEPVVVAEEPQPAPVEVEETVEAVPVEDAEPAVA